MAKIIPVKPLLVHLYGYPGAGKTYFSRQLCEHVQAAHIQADRIRYELFDNPRYDKQENDVIAQLMDYMTEEFLSAGISVVYDANAMRLSQRHNLRELARKGHAMPLLIWLQIDPETAYARTTQRDRRRSDDKFATPMDQQTFEGIASHMQNPANTEDYIVVSGKHIFKTQYGAIMRKMHEMNLIRSDEVVSQVAKPGMVNLIPNPSAGRVDLKRRNIMIR